MRVNRSRIVVGVAVAVVAAGVIATSVAVASAGSGQPSVHGRGAGESAGSRHHGRALFSWFRAGPAPAGWRQVALPGGGAVLSYPGWLGPVSGDAGTVSRALIRAGSTMIYLNVTPRQGDETLRDWAGFRVGHLRDDDARSARLDGSASGLAFRGGTGSCVIDDYVTKVQANHYREIACYVRGAQAASVLVAAAPAADWTRYAALLERAVSSYTVTQGRGAR
jgi:hypothetical protein